GRGNTARVRSTTDAISGTVASYAISDEQGARKKVLDNRQRTAVNRRGWGRKPSFFFWFVWFFASSLLPGAHTRQKVAKIGRLSPGSAPSATIESFLRELRKLGYVEGKNITLESRYADTKLDRLPALADELVSLKVDVGCSLRARVTIR